MFALYGDGAAGSRPAGFVASIFVKEVIVMTTVPEYFGCMVFDDRAMRARLPGWVYNSLKETIEAGRPLNSAVAGEVASAMKDWAVEQRRYAFHALVPAHDRNNSRKARQLHQPRTRRRRYYGVLRHANSFRASRTPPASPPAASAPPLRPAAIPLGTRLPTPSLRATLSAYLQLSAPTAARLWIKRLPCCVPWTLCPVRPCAYFGSSAMRMRGAWCLPSALNRSTSSLTRRCTKNAATWYAPAVPSSAPARPRARSCDDHYFGSIKPRVDSLHEGPR